MATDLALSDSDKGTLNFNKTAHNCLKAYKKIEGPR